MDHSIHLELDALARMKTLMKAAGFAQCDVDHISDLRQTGLWRAFRTLAIGEAHAAPTSHLIIDQNEQVKVEYTLKRIGSDLYLSGRRISVEPYKKLLQERGSYGSIVLFYEDESPPAALLDYLVANPHLIPPSWRPERGRVHDRYLNFLSTRKPKERLIKALALTGDYDRAPRVARCDDMANETTGILEDVDYLVILDSEP